MTLSRELCDELRRAANLAEEQAGFEIPGVETRLWDGQSSRPELRRVNLPVRDTTTWRRGSKPCEDCGESVAGHATIRWRAPHAEHRTMWEERSIHLACPSWASNPPAAPEPEPAASAIDTTTIVEQGWVRTDLGPALRITVQRRDKAPMGFLEVYDAFAAAYPEQWALQCLPPRKHLMNGANKYHLHVLDNQPRAFDLFDRQAPTTKRPGDTRGTR